MANFVSIESLTLRNFGPFYGETVIDFTTKPELPPHILIGGKNGAGKTHLLRALYLAVVGRPGVTDLKKVESGSEATRFSFDKVLNRRARNEGEDSCFLSIAIRQRDADSEKEQFLTLNREVRLRPNSAPDWKSWASRSNDNDIVEDEQHIERLRDAFLPRHLARFFFFDAEKSQSVQLGEPDIVDGISRILGLWAYESLEDQLRQLFQTTNRKLKEDGANDASAKHAEVNGKILTVVGQLKSNDQKRKSLEEERDELNSDLINIEDQLSTIGAVDPQRLQEDQKRRDEINKIKQGLESQLGDAWETALPVALLGHTRNELASRLELEEKRRSWDDRRSAIEPKLPGIKSDVFDNAPSVFRLEDDCLAYYSHRLEEALKGLFNPPPDGVEYVVVFLCDRAETNLGIRQLLSSGYTGLAGLAETSRRLDLMEADVRDLDYQIRQQSQNIAAIGAGKELHEQRAEKRARLQQIDVELKDNSATRANLEAEYTRLQVEEERWAKEEASASKGRSFASRTHAYREAASLVRKKAAERMRSKINEQVGDLWTSIVGREREFSGMEFKGDAWLCSLIKRNGERVPWDDINPSAGQRQVRLLAFYEALRRLAQTVPPLVVDTPLGRLDKEVRTSVLDKLYLSDDGHQSIVLATNAEIDPESALFGKVRDQFGRAYTLEPEGREESDDYEVHIEKNYFGKRI